MKRLTTAAGGVLTAVALLTSVGCSHDSHPSSSSSTTPTTSSPTATAPAPLAFTAHRAAEIRADLSAGDVSRLRDAVAIPPGQTISASVLQSLRSLGSVTFDVSSFDAQGRRAATMTATGLGGVWTVYLVQQSGKWLISATSPAK